MWFAWFGLLLAKVLATQESKVELMVGYNRVVFSGETCPSCLVYIKEGSSVLATTLSGADGKFSYELEYLWEGDHNFLLSSTDGLLNSSGGITYQISIANGTDAKIENIILPPTIIFSQTIAQNSNLIFSGRSIVNGQIIIEVLGQNSWTTTSNSLGEWQISLPTDGWSAGEYNFRVKVISPSGFESEWSLLNTFVVTISSTIPGQEPIVNLPASLTTDQMKMQLDVGAANVIEPIRAANLQSAIWSELPSYGFYSHNDSQRVYSKWLSSYKRHEDGKKSRKICDLNSDLVCDIYDFSILMYLLR